MKTMNAKECLISSEEEAQINDRGRKGKVGFINIDGLG